MRKLLGVCAGSLGVLILPVTAALDRARPTRQPIPPGARTEADVRAWYGKLPLGFEPNHGQTDPQVRFLARASGYTLFLTANEAVLTLEETRPKIVNQGSPNALVPRVLRMRHLGANPSPEVSGLDPLPGRNNYLLGSDPQAWRRGVPTYRKVGYRNLYPGVDLFYYGKRGQLEYDFVVGPGADPSSIRFAMEGARKLRINPNGDLTAQAGAFKIRLRKPFVYQPPVRPRLPATDKRAVNARRVDGRFVLLGNGEVGFEISPFDKSLPLVIDPGLTYSTYLGGSGSDQGTSVAVGPGGTLFVTGTTSSSNFPVSTFALQTALKGTSDAFVTKIDTTQSGSASLVYSTYLGGGDVDSGSSIAVDANGFAYVTGQTASTDFPTPQGFQASLGGSTDAFLAKLDPNGSTLLYSTYLGGRAADAGLGVAVDSNGMAYVTGQTVSNDFPTSPNALRRTAAGGLDAFVTKINTALSGPSSLVYSTYLGGSGDDAGKGIAVDASGSAYVIGQTASTDFPTINAFQTSLGGATDAFVAKLNLNGSSLAYSTYLGGNNSDAGFGIAVASGGLAYVTGQTASPFPIRAGAFQTAPGGGFDAFVSKIDTTQSGAPSLVYSTYLGGSGNDLGRGIATDTFGNAYVTGTTLSLNFPLASPFQSSFGGGTSDAFAAKVKPDGRVLIFSTYLGGTGDDAASGIAVDPNGFVSVIGQTTSTDFPNFHAYQAANNGTTNAFLAQLVGLNLPVIQLSATSLNFTSQNAGTSSAPGIVTLNNIGDGPFVIRSQVAFTGTHARDFALSTGVETTCTPNAQPVGPGGNCNLGVIFTPSALGTRTATMSLTDIPLGSPQAVSLSGTGVCSPEPCAVLIPTSLSFGSVVLGGSSAVQTVTLNNVSTTTPLTLLRISLGGSNPGDFAISSSSCSGSVGAGASCTLGVTFGPTSTGARVAAISITDNARGSPRPIPLSGAGGEFSMSVTPDHVNVAAGSSATYTLSLTSVAGFNQQVDLSCKDPAAASTCTIAPASVTPSGSAASTATVTITTTARSRLVPRRGPRTVPPLTTPRALLGWVVAASMLAAFSRRAETKRRARACLGIVILSLVLWASCGGGGSSAPKGTPVGTYGISLSGTSATTPSLTHNVPVVLNVS